MARSWEETAGRARMPVQRRRRLALAVVAAVVGLVAIVGGYIGVSGSRDVTDQLAYIASGGILGLFLTALASAILIGDHMFEQERSIDDVRELTLGLHSRLDALERAAGLLRGWERPESDPEPIRLDLAFPDASGEGMLVAVPGARRVHDAACPLMAGKPEARPVTVAEVEAERLEPCRVCQPRLAASSTGAGNRP